MTLRAIAGLAILVTGLQTLSAQAPHERNPFAQLSGAIRELTNRVSPAVVQIVVTGFAAADQDNGQTVSQLSQQRSTGSGVIVDSSGYIMTNAHVVQGAVTVKVLGTETGSTGSADPQQTRSTHALDGRIVGMDHDSDLALLKIDAKDLPVLRFGDSDALRQGDLVLAIGSPMGLRNSVSMGLISAPARAINDDNPILYIQTDAPINPGNSGGALVDTSGSLIGLNTFIVSQSGGNEGIGFAIPSNVVRSVYLQLRDKGRVSRGTIGVFVQNLTPLMAKGLGLPQESGVVVADVDPDGPATKAGLKRRDVILSINGSPIETARQFDDFIHRRKGGEKITLAVQRADSRLSVVAELAEQATPWDPLAALVSPEKNLVPRLGVLCIEIDKQLLELMPDLRRKYGVLVAAKSPEGQAQFIDLQPGDIIHAVNNQPVAALLSFQSMIGDLPRGEAVVLQIERDGRFQYIAFEME